MIEKTVEAMIRSNVNPLKPFEQIFPINKPHY